MQKLLIVGLGNPGSQYAHNRHNIGFMILDLLSQTFNLNFKEYSKFKSSLAISQDFILCKPLTFMNCSGEALRLVREHYRSKEMVVIHDELDLALGELRFKNAGGNGGHNGLKSIDLHCGTDYLRARCGIGRPQRKEQVASYVLSDFDMMPTQMMQACLEAMEFFIQTRDFQILQNRFTLRDCK